MERCALVMMLVACSHPTAASLHVPVHGWEHKLGPCGNQYALDGDGVLWTEGGCENGVPELSRVRELGADPEQAAGPVAAPRSRRPTRRRGG